MSRAGFALHGEMTLRALARRRLALAILVALPVALYAVSHDSTGQAVRALLFGVSWAVSTVTFFATVASRQLEPRLRLAGLSARLLAGARIGALLLLALSLAVAFSVLVALDLPVRSPVAVALDFAVTAAVAVAFGTAVGTVISAEMEGALILFFFAGLQAVVNPFDGYAKLLPFWASRELGTYAIDGPGQGSLGWGLIHATAAITLCAVAVVVTSRSYRSQ